MNYDDNFCSCGHTHRDHKVPKWCPGHEDEVRICRYSREVVVGYKKTVTYDSDSDDDDAVGWRPSIIHHNYGGNSAPYVANSYSTTHGNATWITPRGAPTTGYVSSTTSKTAITRWEGCTKNCPACDCEWCQSDEGINHNAEVRRRNAIAYNAHLDELRARDERIKAEREAAARAQAAADLRRRQERREAMQRHREAIKGMFSAIGRAIKSLFTCGRPSEYFRRKKYNVLR
ncbi:coiled coils domain protein [Faustovirus]|nr:coiled coils domain protein [Faustovirus]